MNSGNENLHGYHEALIVHFERCFGSDFQRRILTKGHAAELSKGFHVLEFAPSRAEYWSYATCGMGTEHTDGLELFVLSRNLDVDLVELVTSAAHFHQTGETLGLHHTVNFGRPWQEQSMSEYGYISLPYLHGPALEKFSFGNRFVSCLWLIPVTKAEVAHKKKFGWDELEKKFEWDSFNYLDATRKSVV